MEVGSLTTLDPYRVEGLWGAYGQSKKASARASLQELTPEEKAEVEKLRKTDQQVRSHEQAHRAVGGHYVTGGPNYGYVTGPDGQRYAVEGEVQLDTSEVPGDPEATVRKMETIRRAALAPHDPSPQDHRVAAEASRVGAEARREAMEAKREEQKEQEDGTTPSLFLQVDISV